MTQKAFGSGVLIGVTSGAFPTPVRFGELQEASTDFSFNIKPLFGQKSFAVTAGRGQGKIEIKAKAAHINGKLYNNLFFSQTLITGQITFVDNEAGTVPASFRITVANSVNFEKDYGVIDASTGLPLTRVASSPATGQYSVAAGVYTFATADTGKNVYISYTYTNTTAGSKLAITNVNMDAAPTFELIYSNSYNGQRYTARFNAVYSDKLTLPAKMEDFVIPELSFGVIADTAGNIGTLSFAE